MIGLVFDLIQTDLVCICKSISKCFVNIFALYLCLISFKSMIGSIFDLIQTDLV